MNVSQIYGSMSRLLLYWATGYLPQSTGQLVADVLVVRKVLEVVDERLRRSVVQGGD